MFSCLWLLTTRLLIDVPGWLCKLFIALSSCSDCSSWVSVHMVHSSISYILPIPRNLVQGCGLGFQVVAKLRSRLLLGIMPQISTRSSYSKTFEPGTALSIIASRL